MRITSLVAVLLIVSSTVGVYGQVTAAEVLNALHVRLERSPAIMYTASCEAKLIGIPSILSVSGTVYQQRLDTDTIIRGMIRVDHDSVSTTFKPGEIVEYDLLRKVGVRDQWPLNFDPSNVRLEGVLSLRDQLNPARLIKRTGLGYTQEVKDTLGADGTACWQVYVRMDDNGATTDQWIRYTISQRDSLPVRMIHHLRADGDVQRIDLQLRDIRTKVPMNVFEASSIIPGGQVEDRKSDPGDKPFAQGGSAPATIVGELYGSSAGADTLRFAGKITVLDFWYMACSPCRQSIPALDSLHAGFASRGVEFIGANAYDDTDGSRSRLTQFLITHPIPYPILFIEESTLAAFRVTAHPVVYVIDRTGAVAYSVGGYYSDMRNDIEQVLEELLRQ
jgi:AhpC/TSA family